MTESFSLKDLFVKGLTREQFIERYNDIKVSGGGSEFSIFTDGMEEIAGQMFDTLDSMGNKKTASNGVLDEYEIKELMKLAKNDNKSELTEADLEQFYDKIADNILDKYLKPELQEEQQKTAISKYGKDVDKSGYIKSMDSDISLLAKVTDNRRNYSLSVISRLQSEILRLLSESKKLENSSEYTNAVKELDNLRKSESANRSNIEKTEREIANKKDKAELIKQSISDLDPEKDADKIKSKQDELSTVKSDIQGLDKKLAEYINYGKKLKADISKTNNRLIEINRAVLVKNDRIKSQIGQLQANIQLEKENVENDILNYRQSIDYIQSTKSYTYQKTVTGRNTGTSQPVTTQPGSSRNNNAMTFSELEAQGLKYSSSKGHKLSNYVGSRAGKFIGMCSNRVANGLQGTRLGNERMPSACQMDDALRWDISSGKNDNYREIKITSKEDLDNLPAGCILVYEAGARWGNGSKEHYNNKDGHIEVTLGNGTAASDGITRNIKYTPGQMSVFVPVEKA